MTAPSLVPTISHCQRVVLTLLGFVQVAVIYVEELLLRVSETLFLIAIPAVTLTVAL